MALTEITLLPDMIDLAGQVVAATLCHCGSMSQRVKFYRFRLAGVEAPTMPDTETTFDELRDRIARTIAFVETIRPQQVNGDEDRTIELQLPTRTIPFTARSFVFRFSLPNLMFHVTTAYGLIRAQGVPLGKIDYLAGPSAQLN